MSAEWNRRWIAAQGSAYVSRDWKWAKRSRGCMRDARPEGKDPPRIEPIRRSRGSLARRGFAQLAGWTRSEERAERPGGLLRAQPGPRARGTCPNLAVQGIFR